MKPKSKIQIEAARLHLDYCFRVLRANESLWDAEWASAPNPFIAVKNYLSKAQRTKRKPIIDAWLNARDVYDAIKPKKETA